MKSYLKDMLQLSHMAKKINKINIYIFHQYIFGHFLYIYNNNNNFEKKKKYSKAFKNIYLPFVYFTPKTTFTWHIWGKTLLVVYNMWAHMNKNQHDYTLQYSEKYIITIYKN